MLSKWHDVLMEDDADAFRMFLPGPPDVSHFGGHDLPVQGLQRHFLFLELPDHFVMGVAGCSVPARRLLHVSTVSTTSLFFSPDQVGRSVPRCCSI